MYLIFRLFLPLFKILKKLTWNLRVHLSLYFVGPVISDVLSNFRSLFDEIARVTGKVPSHTFK